MAGAVMLAIVLVGLIGPSAAQHTNAETVRA